MNLFTNTMHVITIQNKSKDYKKKGDKTMSFVNTIIEFMKGWGVTEWSLAATVLIELVVIIFFNKGILIAQSKLQAYEKELKDTSDELTHYKELFEERGEN